MGRICSQVSTGKPLQYCSSSDAQTLKDNAVTGFGIPTNDLEVLENQTENDFSNLQSGALSLADYKTEAKKSEKAKGKKLFVNYRDELDTSNADASTYKTNLKNYFISDVKAPINAASTKAEVDTAVAVIDWSSVVYE
jgi:hypothetical protein|tara:strand:+ start:436 stop:849 length:414 start_codon:yes stop_codon:yes gene_type:complete